MLKILIVEDDAALAATLKYLVEDNPRYRVIAMASDEEEVLRAVQAEAPDLALVDLKLAHGSTGYSVAVRLSDMDVPSLFVTGRAPDFAMPELALGCLLKPFTAEDVHRALSAAEDMMRWREPLRKRMPDNLMMWQSEDVDEMPSPGFIPSKRSLRTRLDQWLAGTQTDAA